MSSAFLPFDRGCDSVSSSYGFSFCRLGCQEEVDWEGGKGKGEVESGGGGGEISMRVGVGGGGGGSNWGVCVRGLGYDVGVLWGKGGMEGVRGKGKSRENVEARGLWMRGGVGDGGWRMEDGGWVMKDAGWRMEDGGWKDGGLG